MFQWVIENCLVIDGGPSSVPVKADVGVCNGVIGEIGNLHGRAASERMDGGGQVLSPGFIDVHTHDDLALMRDPDMLPKIAQGVTTVITGNCGISGYQSHLHDAAIPDPMNLLGNPEEFQFPELSDFIVRLEQNPPAVNAACLIGHTSLRNNHLDILSNPATSQQLEDMCRDLESGMKHGALGLSSGLAYANARNAPASEIESLLNIVQQHNGVYTTHLRNEFDLITEAIEEASTSARKKGVPLIISHHKVAGPDNWGRSKETLALMDSLGKNQSLACDCYPYSASSSTLDPGQVNDRIRIDITWSRPHPEMAGKSIQDIAKIWNIQLDEATRRMMPAGAIYYNMEEADVHRILKWDRCMIGSDGLPCDPNPHPRLYGSFPRVLGKLVRDSKLFDLPTAIHKMSGLPASVFPLGKTGRLLPGYTADMTLFDPDEILDTASFDRPKCFPSGIRGVWVNGTLAFTPQAQVLTRNGRFRPRALT